MKQKAFYPFFFLVLLLLATGCENPEYRQPAVSHILKGTLERGATTKTHFEDPVDGIYYPYWSSKDALAVYVDGIDLPDKYVLVDGAGTDKGAFSGKITGNRYVALYPYADRVRNGLKGDELSLVLPGTQVYAPNSFGEGAFPMLGLGDEQDLSFKNLCAVLKFSMTGSAAVKAVRFVAHDTTMAVCGPAKVRTDFTTEPALVMDEGGTHTVTLQCPGVQLYEDNATEFFVVIPAGTYRGGFSLEIETFSGTFTRSVNSDVSFGRSQFRYIKPFRCDADGAIDPDDIPYNQIWYVSYGEQVLDFPPDAFDRNILSNTYKDGKGVILFDGPVTQVGRDAFYANITEIHLPNTIESIGDFAFYADPFTSFRTPDNLKTVGRCAFMYCSYLTRIYGRHASADEKCLVLDDGTMVAYALGWLTESGTITVPEGVTALAPNLFYWQSRIHDVVFSEGFKSLGDYCFQECSDLETVTFPESFDEIGELVFLGCSNLREFKGNSPRVPDGHALVDKDGYMQAFAGQGITDYVIPDGVTQFIYCFRSNKSLRSLTLPESLKNYGSDPFDECDNLEFLYGPYTTEDHHCWVMGNTLVSATPVLPADYAVPEGYGIECIYYNAFVDNQYVEHLSIPDEVKQIWDYAFSYMPRLKTLRLPASLTRMINPLMGTKSLDTLYVRSYAPPTYYEDSGIGAGFDHEGLVICVPEGTELVYKSTSPWSNYEKYIEGFHYDDLTPPDYYLSSDYSQDGVVTTLQTASEGRGIDLVLMGDGYSDRQIVDGTYASVMNKMMEAFFSEEPYTTYRNLFNVYVVNAVSATEGYDHPGQSLSGFFGDGTYVGGDDTKCMTYARAVIPAERMENALIIVAMNSPRYGGTCFMYNPMAGDYGCGTSVAYFPVGETDEGLAQLVRHEAGGHGFAKLDDEYAYIEMGAIPDDVKEYRKYLMTFGWWKNVDFTSDPDQVQWARFLQDPRYQFDGLGVFEGACTYWTGAWRPTENSIMRYNTGGFNAPSREAIWYRLHKLAYGDEWTYDYEEFVAYDAVNRKTSAAVSGETYSPQRQYGPTHPPVAVGKTWQEAMSGK